MPPPVEPDAHTGADVAATPVEGSTTPVQTFTYEHPWEYLVEAYRRRFPKHPRIKVMLGATLLSDVVEEFHHQESGAGKAEKRLRRHTEREVKLDLEIPSMLKWTFKVYDITFLQTIYIDPTARVMLILNKNKVDSQKS